LLALPVVADQVPRPPAEHQTPRIHLPVALFPLRGAIAEPEPPVPGNALGDLTEMGTRGIDPARSGLAGERRQHPALGAEGQLPEGLSRFPRLSGRVGRHEQGRHLVGGERDVGKLVALLGDPVGLVDVPRVGGLDLDGDTDGSQRVLVPLELPLGGRRVLLVVRSQRRADLLVRQGTLRFQEQRDEVEQTFERVHPR
jgi:hypothetical protein